MARTKSPKTFVLDTNVILHDPTCITQFEENNIVIPLTVIEEIDHFKRGSQVINLNAREFTRTLDNLTGSAIFNGGVSIGNGKGKVRIVISKGLSKEIQESFREDTPDHRILSVAYNLLQTSKDKKKIILVSKDVNLRMKAKAMGLMAENYTTDRIGSVDHLYTGKDIIEDFNDDLIQKFYKAPFEVEAKKIGKSIKEELVPNKFFIIRNQNRSVLANLNQDEELFL
jgi:PhoH-like ATPase